MWIRRLHYETMFENLTIERAKNTSLESRLAAMTSTQEWLMAHVNRLENERRILTEARLGLSFPTPTIERADAGTEALAQAEEKITGGIVRGLPQESIPLGQMMAASLEDVGDDEAKALGIEHDAQGFVVYRR